MSKVDKIVATRSFENAVKQLKKKNATSVLKELHNVIIQLANYEITKQKANHPLKNAEGHKDIHLNGGKLILLYKYEDDVLTIALRLQDVVNHTQLHSYNNKKYNAPTSEYDPENIDTSENIHASIDFMNWYDSLAEEEQWAVDDIADSEGVPLYEDASDDELNWLMDQFETQRHKSIEGSDEADIFVEDTNQEYHSDATSINSNKLPAIYRMVEFHPGDVVLDFGGGKFDNAVNHLKDKDVTLLVYDPYNRSKEHNDEVIQILKEHGGADAAVNSNVLNVIKEASARSTVLKNITRLTKKGAPVYITVYEGRGDNQGGPTKSGYQLNRRTADYLEEIQEIFPDAVRKGKLIIAHNSANVSSSTSVKCSITLSDEDIHDMLTDLRSDLKRVLLHTLTSDDFGFDKDEAERKSNVDVTMYPDHRAFVIEIRAELDYDNLDTLAKVLDEEVITYYVPDAYFDFEGPESLVTEFELSDVRPEVLEAYNAKYDELNNPQEFNAATNLCSTEISCSAAANIDNDIEYVQGYSNEEYIEFDDDAEIWIPFDEVITIDEDRWITFADEHLDFCSSPDGQPDHYDDRYHVYLDDNSGVCDKLCELLDKLLPNEPGKYHIKGNLSLIYDIDNMCKYSNNDGYYDKYEEEYYPSTYEIDTSRAYVTWNDRDSRIEQFTYKNLT